MRSLTRPLTPSSSRAFGSYAMLSHRAPQTSALDRGATSYSATTPATAEGRLPLTLPADAGTSVTHSERRAASIEYSRSKAHRLKSVDGSQSVLRGRLALAAIDAISVSGQLSLKHTPASEPIRMR